LYRPPEGEAQVRCAVVLDRPLETVWAVVTDYDHYADIFPTLTEAEGKSGADGGELRGSARAWPLGSWPVEIRFRHDVTPDRRVASWDSPGGDLVVNRGSWTLTRLPNGRTLLVYALTVRSASFPRVVINNVLLDRNPQAVAAARDAVARRAAPP
jgi:uncharacterized membrane protein